jgi:hypothetical protein
MHGNAAANTEDKREKIQALSLAKECYSMKLDLLTNATVKLRNQEEKMEIFDYRLALEFYHHRSD